MKISNAVLLVLAACACVAAAPHVAAADPPDIYLTWHAPYGYPRAADTLSATPCDSTMADTLWLSFDPGKASPTYLGYMATLLIHPAFGDTLPAWWTKDFGKGKPPFFDIGLEPVPGYGYPMPYRKNGGGGTEYDGLLKDARYRLIYATPYNDAAAIERKTYVLARLIIRRPPANDPACGVPICIEWSESELNYDIGNSRAFVSTGTHRIVSMNSRGGEVATPYRRAAQLKGWKLTHP
jgi:hypothetical protein